MKWLNFKVLTYKWNKNENDMNFYDIIRQEMIKIYAKNQGCKQIQVPD